MNQPNIRKLARRRRSIARRLAQLKYASAKLAREESRAATRGSLA